MEYVEEIIGLTVANDGKALIELFGGGHMKHIGNFIFQVHARGLRYEVITEPADEDFERITVTGIYLK